MRNRRPFAEYQEFGNDKIDHHAGQDTGGLGDELEGGVKKDKNPFQYKNINRQPKEGAQEIGQPAPERGRLPGGIPLKGPEVIEKVVLSPGDEETPCAYRNRGKAQQINKNKKNSQIGDGSEPPGNAKTKEFTDHNIFRIFQTPVKASKKYFFDIFETPRFRSGKTMGISVILQPSFQALYFISIWKE
jgi:hypothetical protein